MLLVRLAAAAFAVAAALGTASAASAAPPLPPGPNRDLVAGVCGACHDPQYLSESAGLGRSDWSSVLDGMRQFGLKLAPPEREKILEYLATYLGPHPPAAPAPPAKPAAAAAEASSIEPFLSHADPKRGESLAAVCAVCHSFAKGAPNQIGPNLFDVVGSKIAAGRNGFDFSAALKQHSGVWTVEQLNRWLYDPEKFAPGTRMTFPGIEDPQQRADVIAYLQSLH